MVFGFEEFIALLLKELVLNIFIDFLPNVLDIVLLNWFKELKIDVYFYFVDSPCGVAGFLVVSYCNRLYYKPFYF